ncbi:MAG: glycerophosphodiester phosphodiesterase family protein [Candidatus Hadarchaeum sp.]|uniref:glycerophosphodiester phosphodiesterase n=1 Tax=Candidatus Hadarchaeum sp. TaxID=2883567 RepID=UPI00317782DB
MKNINEQLGLLLFVIVIFHIHSAICKSEGGNMEHILIIAHRGVSSLAPENTLIAGQKVANIGADGWEIDVRMTKDGELVLLHDATLERTTDVRNKYPHRDDYKVESFTYSDLLMLSAGAWFVDLDPFGTIAAGKIAPEEILAYRSARIPLLDEALQLAKQHGLILIIEIKGRDHYTAGIPASYKAMVQRIVSAIRRFQAEHLVYLCSFDHDLVRYVAELAPEIKTGPIFGNLPINLISYLQHLDADFISIKWTLLNKELCTELARHGYKVFTWTVNDPEAMKELVQWKGITGIISDWPQELLKILPKR